MSPPTDTPSTVLPEPGTFRSGVFSRKHETRSGMVVSWDRKTSVFIRLQQGYKVRVGGLGTPSGRDRSGPEGTVWQLTIHGGLGPVHSQCQLLKRQVLRPKGPTD